MGILFDLNKIKLLLEGNIDDSLESCAAHTISHMIKYKNQPDKQSLSWVSTIIRTSEKCIGLKTNTLNKFLNKNNDDFIMDRIYRKSKNDLIHDKVDKFCKEEMKADRPEWTLEQISDKEFIKDFLYDNASNISKEEIDEKSKRSNLL